MPAMKCSNGKWKWGRRGKCVYDTKKKAEEAGRAIKAKESNNSNMSNSKKDLKAKINENGFFLQISDIEKLEENAIKDVRENAVKTKVKIPEGENILIFTGKASQNFPKGKVSRNDYKIDVKGWDLSAYRKNAQILLSHNPEEPIGKTISLDKNEDGLNITYFVDLDWMSEVDSKRMQGGAFSGLSTGHITREMKFEDKETGELFTDTQLEKKGVDIFWDILMSNDPAYVPVVTKAELVEVSAVTLPSNPEALTMQNSLKHFFENQMTKLKKNEEEKIETPEETQETKKEAPENDASETIEEETPEVAEQAAEDAEPEVAPETDGEDAEPSEAEPEETEESEEPEPAEEKTVVSENSKKELNDLIASKESELVKLKELNDTIVAKNETTKQEVAPKEDNGVIKVVTNLTTLVLNQGAKIEKLESIIEEIPSSKGSKLTNQFAPIVTEI